jgi:hypothetical protein
MYANFGPGREVALAPASSGPEITYSHEYVATRMLQRNLYAYCDNNPVNWTDPSGLKKGPFPLPATAPKPTLPIPNAPSFLSKLGKFCTNRILGPLSIILLDPTPMGDAEFHCRPAPRRPTRDCGVFDCTVSADKKGCISNSCPTGCSCAVADFDPCTGDVKACVCAKA